MKQLLVFSLVFILLLGSCEQKPSFKIEAEFAGATDSDFIYMQLVQDSDLVTVDSAQLVDSKVLFEGTLNGPQMVYLKVGDSRKVVNFFGENSEIKVSAKLEDLENTVVNGSAVHDQFLGFQEYMKPIDEKEQKIRDDYREAAQAGDSEKMQALSGDFDKVYDEQQNMLYQYIADKNSSYMAPFVIKRYLVYELDENKLDSLLQKLDPSVHDSPDYISLNERVEILKKVAVGQPALDFTLSDPDGNPIALSSFKGKVLLIDFWASWCGPCRKENPNVVKLYDDFNDKGFEILGVSLDESRERWLKAIEDDSLTWPHVSDLEGWQSSAGKLYGVNSIPATVLVNSEGIIIDKDLRGEELRKKLEEVFQVEDQNI
jgi:peroxiredoxin